MKIKRRREIITSLANKIKKGERLNLTERGIFDILYGKGNKPVMPFPNWIKNGKKKNVKVKKYYD